MKNPLSDLEKRIILKHWSHDIRGALGHLYYMFELEGVTPQSANAAWGKSNVTHIKNSTTALECLTDSNINLHNVSAKDVMKRLEENKAAVLRKNDHIEFNVDNLSPFDTQIDVLGLALYTLMGNSALQVTGGGVGKISITASDYEGTLPNLVYQNPDAPIIGKFKRFRIKDTGIGFPYGMKFLETKDADLPEDVIGHFGLRLTRIICKYLMSHFAILPKVDASGRGADISIYHPQDIKSLYKL